MKKRPESNEYIEYYSLYINMVPEGDIIQILNEQVKDTVALLKDLTEPQAEFRYEEGKWSIKQLIGHIADTERVMIYRLLCIARGETVSLPGFDQNAYMDNASFDEQTIDDLLADLTAVRMASVTLLKGLKEHDWAKMGIANQANVSVRALAYIMAGHERHHRAFIKERYIGSPQFPNS
ncbi:MAG: DinB family protein [Tuberibacillus sp.]